MAHTSELATAVEVVRRTNAEIAFLSGVTDIGLDDDLLHLRSRQVVLEGYSHTNNPNKGLGVIHHGTASNCSALYCGGHVASRKETTIECVEIVLMSLTGASIESQISLNGTTFFWDRGYGGVEGEVNSFALEKGAVLIGTARRRKSFPFTFDQQPGSARRLVQEKGSMASYWAVKTTPSGRQQYALAHRNGLGRVVLIQTMDPNLGPGRYTLITKSNKQAKIWFRMKDDTVPDYALGKTSNVTMLTESQRTPAWFLLRKFRITGTGSYSTWRLISNLHRGDGNELDENFVAVLDFLRLDGGAVTPDVQEADDKVYELEELNATILTDLCCICRKKTTWCLWNEGKHHC